MPKLVVVAAVAAAAASNAALQLSNQFCLQSLKPWDPSESTLATARIDCFSSVDSGTVQNFGLT